MQEVKMPDRFARHKNAQRRNAGNANDCETVRFLVSLIWYD